LITGSDDMSIGIFDIQAKKEIHKFEKVYDGNLKKKRNYLGLKQNF